MPLEVIMPALGMAQDTGRLVTWLKEPGAPVAEGDALFEVETDKATMEVEAQGAGYLTGVTARAGSDVPVGQVIAQISDTPEPSGAPAAVPEPGPETEPEAEPGPDLPDGHEVIMPTLGMAQETGLLVSWHKEPGAEVIADDVLFEVETDKSTVEVAAGTDGYVAALLAEAGQDVPVGRTIAIISAEKPENPVMRAAVAAPVAEPAADPAAAVARPPEKAEERTGPAPGPRTDGRILASPKARRLAMEQGLDLTRLAGAGYKQPYHVSDLDTLKSLPAASAQPTPASSGQQYQVTARAAVSPTEEFLRWMLEDGGLILPASALWSAFAAGALRAAQGTKADLIIELAPLPGPARRYANPDRTRLSDPGETVADPPDLILRDLTASPITGLRLGPRDCPVLSVARDGDDLRLTLDFTAGQLCDEAAIALLTGFAERLEEPLMHLL